MKTQAELDEMVGEVEAAGHELLSKMRELVETIDELDEDSEDEAMQEARSQLDEAITHVEFVAEGMPTLEIK